MLPLTEKNISETLLKKRLQFFRNKNTPIFPTGVKLIFPDKCVTIKSCQIKKNMEFDNIKRESEIK